MSSSFIFDTRVVGPLQCNCMLLACEKTREGVLIDPGADAKDILEMVTKAGVQIKYLIHTHAHFDHIGATAAIKDPLKAAPCLHKEDLMIYENLPMQGQMFGFHFEPAPAIEKFVEDEEVLKFGELGLKVIHTPGHSPGSVCLELQGTDVPKIFSGDTLFHQSIGRADLWGGDGDKLIRSIKDRLMILDGDIEVFPGHGPKTSIGFEKTSNPFL